jgi:hypothetical protein
LSQIEWSEFRRVSCAQFGWPTAATAKCTVVIQVPAITSEATGDHWLPVASIGYVLVVAFPGDARGDP